MSDYRGIEKICPNCLETFVDWNGCPHCIVELVDKKEYDLGQAKNRRDEELEGGRIFTMHVPKWEGEENEGKV